MIVLATSCFGVFFLWRWRRQQESKVVFILVVCSFTGCIFDRAKTKSSSNLDRIAFVSPANLDPIAHLVGTIALPTWRRPIPATPHFGSRHMKVTIVIYGHHPSNHENPGFWTDYFRGHTMQKLCSRTLCHPVVDPLGLQSHWMTKGGMIHVSKCIRKMSFYLQIAI